MLSYVFLGTPDFAVRVVEGLVAAGLSPLAIVTQPAKPSGRGRRVEPSAVETWARAHGIAVHAVVNANAPEVIDRLRALSPDLILVAAFGQILREELLGLPRKGCLNVHGSLLPKYRGAAPVHRAIWNGDTETGITIQKMARKLDTGDTLVQRRTAIGPDETSGELMGRLAVLGGECLAEAVSLIESGSARFTPQDEKLATYAAKISKDDAAIDWQRPAAAIGNQIRALNPWPVAEGRLGGVRLKLFRATPAEWPGAASAPAGSIWTDGRERLAVRCEPGALSLTELQLENRKRLGIREFLSAYRGSFPHPGMG